MSRVINTTPHDCHMYLADNTVITYPKTKELTIRSRLYDDGPREPIDGRMDVVGNGHFMPDLNSIKFDFQDGDVVIVSMVDGLGIQNSSKEDFLSAFQKKKIRFVSPDSGPEYSIRNEKGQILGCRRFVEYYGPFGQWTHMPCRACEGLNKEHNSYCLERGNKCPSIKTVGDLLLELIKEDQANNVDTQPKVFAYSLANPGKGCIVDISTHDAMIHFNLRSHDKNEKCCDTCLLVKDSPTSVNEEEGDMK